MYIIYYDEFRPGMLFLNPNTHFVYVEAAQKRGGDAAVIQLRNSQRGLSVTMLEQYLQDDMRGQLQDETYQRDFKTIEEEFKRITYVVRSGGIVWLPSKEIQVQITCLEKSSPKMAGHIMKRLEHLTLNYSPPSIELP
jgi:hypothetical protein